MPRGEGLPGRQGKTGVDNGEGKIFETSGAERRQEASVEQGGKKEKAENGVLWRISKLRVS